MRIIVAAMTLLCLVSTAEGRGHDDSSPRVQCRAYSTPAGAWTTQCAQPDVRPPVWCDTYARLMPRDVRAAARLCGR